MFRTIYRIDAVLNVGSGVFALLWPAAFLNQFVAEPLPSIAAAAVPWFGALLLIMGIIEWQLLRRPDRASLVAFMVGLLIGDPLYIWAFSHFVNAHGVWNLQSFLSVGTTATFCGFRIYYLLHPDRIPSEDARGPTLRGNHG